MSNSNPFGEKKIAFYTLGCKLNFTETSAIGKQLLERGFVRANADEYANVCIINTCSVTDLADKKCRYTIKKAIRENPHAFIVVTGCYAQLKPEEVADLKGVDLVLGSNEKDLLPEYLEKVEEGTSLNSVNISKFKDIVHFKPSWSSGNRTRSFLKVQDGCDYFCTFCTIPMARGRNRSGTILQTVDEARNAALAGAKEIVLTGVNIGEFGTKGGETFFELIKALDEVEGIDRFRISSIEPNLLTDDIITWVAKSKKFMPHFHIPLQSGNNEMLRLMERKYSRELFAHKVRLIKENIPEAFIGVDVIVGMRGEEDEYFKDTYQFLKELPISQLHVFTYSERTGTKALKIDYVVDPQEKKLRSEMLHVLSEEKRKTFYAKYINTTSKVLWESKKKGNLMQGFTTNYIRVERPYEVDRINQITEETLCNINDDASALVTV